MSSTGQVDIGLQALCCSPKVLAVTIHPLLTISKHPKTEKKAPLHLHIFIIFQV